MTRSTHRWLAICLAFLLSQAAFPSRLRAEIWLALDRADIVGNTQRLVDPLPIRRIILPRELASSIPQPSVGTKQIQMPLSQFEALLRRAASRAGEPKGATILTASYELDHHETGLIGTGTFLIESFAATTSFLALPHLPGAIRSLRLDDTPAELIDPGDGVPGVLLTKRGRQKLHFGLSQRPERTAQGIRYDLRFPSAAISTLRVFLPPGKLPVVQQDTVGIEGPAPTAKKDSLCWIVHLGGTNRLELLVRPATGQNVPVFARRRTSVKLEPGWQTIDLDFALERAQPLPRELTLSFPASHRVVQVASRDQLLEFLELANSPGKPRSLRIKLPEQPSTSSASIKVQLISAFTPTGDWEMPQCSLEDVILLEDEPVILVSQQWDLTSWDPGSYRIARSQTDADGYLSLHLKRQSLRAGDLPASSNYPKARLRWANAAMTGRNVSYWVIRRQSAALTSQSLIRVAHGSTRSINLSLPEGYKLSSAAIGGLKISPDLGAAGMVQLRLPELLRSGGEAILTLELESIPIVTGADGSARLAAPRIAILDCTMETDLLGIRVENPWLANTEALKGALSISQHDLADELEQLAPWKQEALWGIYLLPFTKNPIWLSLGAQPPTLERENRRSEARITANPPQWSRAKLLVEPHSVGGVWYELTGELSGCHERSLRMSLPGSARIQSARAQGMLHSGAELNLAASTESTILPWDPESKNNAIQLQYLKPLSWWLGLAWIQLAAPTLSPALEDHQIELTLPEGVHAIGSPDLVPGAGIWIIKDRTVLIGQAALGIVILGACWRIRRARGAVYWPVFFFGAGLACVVGFLPAPLNGACWVLAVVMVLAFLSRSIPAGRGGLVAGIILSLLLPIANAQSTGGIDSAVWIRLGKNGLSDATAQASADLVGRIRAMSAPTATPRKASLTRALYEGRIGPLGADLVARYSIISFTDAPEQIRIPIVGLELREALLDGQPAFPTATSPANGGYLVWVQGKGVHELALSGRVALAERAGFVELRLGIPALYVSQLKILLPDDVREAAATTARGVQDILEAGNERALRADVGAASQLAVRWTPNGTPTGAGSLHLHEHYLWEVGQWIERLQAAWTLVGVPQGGTQASWRIPAGWYVRSIQAVPPQGGPLAPRIVDWRIEAQAEASHLHVNIGASSGGSALLLVELARPALWGAATKLVLPTAEKIHSVSGILGYSTLGQPMQMEAKRLTALDVASFRKLLPMQASGSIEAVDAAFRFQRTSDGSPELELRAMPLAQPHRTSQHWSWQLTPDYAIVKVEATIRSSNEPVSFVDWSVPDSVEVLEVQGRSVRGWEHSTGRLRVWLTQSRSTARLSWTGRSLPKDGVFHLEGSAPKDSLLAQSEIQISGLGKLRVQLSQHIGLTQEEERDGQKRFSSRSARFACSGKLLLGDQLAPSHFPFNPLLR